MPKRIENVGKWVINNKRLLTYNNRLYILEDGAIRVKLLKRNYNNLLTGYFNIKKIYKLLYQNYF